MLQFRFHRIDFVELFALQAVLLQVIDTVTHHQRQIDVVMTMAAHESQP